MTSPVSPQLAQARARAAAYLADCANPDGCDEDGPPRVAACHDHPLYDDDLRALLAALPAEPAVTEPPECPTCGKRRWPVTHSCTGIRPAEPAANYVRCCGPRAEPCCAYPTPLAGHKRVGAVHRPVWTCDECGAELTLSQVHHAHGLHAEPAADARPDAGEHWEAMAHAYRADLAAVEMLCEEWRQRPGDLLAQGVAADDVEDALSARPQRTVGLSQRDRHSLAHVLLSAAEAAPQPAGPTEPACPCGETGARCRAPIDCGRRHPAPQPAGEDQ